MCSSALVCILLDSRRSKAEYTRQGEISGDSPDSLPFQFWLECRYLVPKRLSWFKKDNQTVSFLLPALLACSAFHLKDLSLLYFISTHCVPAGVNCPPRPMEFWDRALIISHAIITRVKIFFWVIWVENASFLFSPTFLPLWGKNCGEKRLHQKSNTR